MLIHDESMVKKMDNNGGSPIAGWFIYVYFMEHPKNLKWRIPKAFVYWIYIYIQSIIEMMYTNGFSYIP